MRCNKFIVDLSVIKNNYAYLKSKTESEVGCVLKSDAYGIGIKEVSLILAKNGAKSFFVATLDEGIELRKILGMPYLIYVLHGFLDKELPEFAEHNLIPIINNKHQFDSLSKFSYQKQKALEYGLHINTGLNRLGMNTYEFSDLIDEIINMKHLVPDLVMSHLAYGFDCMSHYNESQLENFNNAIQKVRIHNLFNKVRFSFANSAGTLFGKKYHYDLTRCGAALYGIKCTNHLDISNIKLPVKYISEIIHVNDLGSGQYVGYDCTYKTESNKRIITIPIGYSEKLPRGFSNTGYCVRIDNYLAPVIGLISMNLITVDATDIPKNLIYIGQNVTVLDHDLLQRTNFHQYEFLTNFANVGFREYVGN